MGKCAIQIGGVYMRRFQTIAGDPGPDPLPSRGRWLQEFGIPDHIFEREDRWGHTCLKSKNNSGYDLSKWKPLIDTS